ncbi:hypothetical protein [Blastococcus litoris]|uniref:hypothetical protein n=1 Tax=Blastococcus litoris TaxID=2171622 RepID=UPI000E303490|nr:hypothetical protein [Blastococcus litoris]
MSSAAQLAEIEELVRESEAISDELQALQVEKATPAQIRRAQDRYQQWYARALRHVPDSDAARFRNYYEGDSFITRIKGYLANPRKPSA